MTPREFVAACRDCLALPDVPAHIARLMKQALASQAAGGEWGRELLLHRAPDLFIVDLTLAPGDRSPIHDHGTWAVIGISSGCEIERFHARDGSGLKPTHEARLGPGDTIVLSPETIHAIENPLAVPARGIHVYGADIAAAGSRRMWHPATGEEHPYEHGTFERWAAALKPASTGESKPA